jgi:hypothetical protein
MPGQTLMYHALDRMPYFDDHSIMPGQTLMYHALDRFDDHGICLVKHNIVILHDKSNRPKYT